MSSTNTLLLVLGISLWGLLIPIRKRNKITEHISFSENFLQLLKQYWNSGGRDNEAYSQLLHDSHKMQNIMGGLGVFVHYQPPYRNYMMKNYPVILNMLPELRQTLDDEFLSAQLASNYMNAMQETLIRYMGYLDNQLETNKQELVNPIKWFRNGIREVLSLPIQLLDWLDIINHQKAATAITSKLFKIIAGVVALISFFSAIVTIVTGWKPFIGLVQNIMI
ncbi:hypothetical protein D5085_07595 [Ectothiorhodospiraceae bacterium BW-2]|nr:hypothetical protein D5085_07595 [Ectothiorhodospiraceae bacterium BW-2]